MHDIHDKFAPPWVYVCGSFEVFLVLGRIKCNHKLKLESRYWFIFSIENVSYEGSAISCNIYFYSSIRTG